MSGPGKEPPTKTDEAELFRKMVEGVRPLKADGRADLRSQKKRASQHRPHPEHTTRHGESEPFPLNEEDRVEPEESLLYVRSPLPHSTLRKLRKGEPCSSMEIDLHGLNSREATEALDEFLVEAVAHRVRCFHLIHGKGRRSADQLPVLKSLVNRWLRQRREVLAFCSARQRDGGTGALYVLLKRQPPQE